MHHFTTNYALIVILLIGLIWFYSQLKSVIKGWTQGFRKYIKTRKTKALEEIFVTLYPGNTAFSISRDDRKHLEMSENREFTYGEIVFSSFIDVLQGVNPKPHEVFYDLGSGGGKAVITAALYFDFAKTCGIELLPGLHELSNKKLKLLQKLTCSQHLGRKKKYEQKVKRIQFINNNFLDQDISDANIIFLNATCFSDDTINALVEKFSHLSKGSRIILNTKTITRPDFTLLNSAPFEMSWGPCQVNTYLKSK